MGAFQVCSMSKKLLSSLVCFYICDVAINVLTGMCRCIDVISGGFFDSA